ncbi:MAG TPA: hypothetical protein VE978_08405 [Chitinophagales bacterium]|nr:hypothetical protein [Chitinophagales bacterium]
MEEKEINEQESLEIISQMIQSAKVALSNDGIFYLLWGFAVFIAAIAQFIMLQIGISNDGLVWPVVTVAAGIASAFVGRRRAHKIRVKTFVEEAIDYTWMAFGISLFIVLVFGYRNMNWESVYPMMMILYGIGTFISGGALRFRPLKAGGLFCWACAVAAFFVPFLYQLLIISAAVLFGFIIPGFMLRSRYKREAALSIS